MKIVESHFALPSDRDFGVPDPPSYKFTVSHEYYQSGKKEYFLTCESGVTSASEKGTLVGDHGCE